MPEPTVHTTEHTIDVDADVDTVYPIIADVTRWPYTFGPTVHVARIEGDERVERLRLWATANGVVRSWTSRRVLESAAGRISFRQEASAAPVASMGGQWRLLPLGDGRTRVVLLHDFTVVNDEPGAAAWVGKAVDSNSRTELTALKSTAEAAAGQAATFLAFTDSVPVAAPAAHVYDFLYHADRWDTLLPHVSRVVLTEDDPNVQVLEMDTRTPDGSVHTTSSVRICFPTERIVYKQTTMPPLMAAHTGAWRLHPEPDGTGVVATAQHTVVLRPERVSDLLGPDATLADARDLVRRSLGANSTRTLQLAKRHLEHTPAID